MDYLTSEGSMTQVIDQRRYDIDWLRTLAFIVLILYHVGMFYVADWGWHIKSAEQSVWLQNVMLLTNPWRMSLLFFISAMAMSLVMSRDKFSASSLVKIRSKRLLIPLVFAMIVVVPPQLFYELKQFYGFTDGYVVFMQQYLDINTQLAPQKQSPIGLLTWNHLWFLPYLWCYSILLLLIYPLFARVSRFIITSKTPTWLALVILLLGTASIRLLLSKDFPVTHALVDDWFNHAHYFWVFVAGFMLPRLPHFWQRLVDCRRLMLMFALIGYVWLLMDRHGLLSVGQELDRLWFIQFAHSMLISFNHWTWILALVGYAGRYLQFSNQFLRYANKAILPWYILHQTLIVLFAVCLSALSISVEIEVFLLILFTVLGCALGYAIISRVRFLKLVFGMKSS
jgi:hypothetical protein